MNSEKLAQLAALSVLAAVPVLARPKRGRGYAGRREDDRGVQARKRRKTLARETKKHVRRGETVKLAFVSGAYRSDTEAGVRRNIEAAREVMEGLLKAGFAVHCPHTNTAFMGGIVPDEVFLAADLEILSRCDLLVTVEGWAKSAGAIGEVGFAIEHGIPVRHCVRDAELWLKEQGK